MSDYPGAIDEFREIENLPGLAYDAEDKRTFFAEDLNAVDSAVIAIEETLGTNPQGTYPTVAERLNDAGTGNVFSEVVDSVPLSLPVFANDDGKQIIDIPQIYIDSLDGSMMFGTYVAINPLTGRIYGANIPVDDAELVNKYYLEQIVGGGTKVLDKYIAITDLFNNAAMTANTWYDITSNQTFEIDNEDSQIQFNVGGFIKVGGTNPGDFGCRLVIDSATENIQLKLSGNTSFSGNWYVNALAGVNTLTVDGLEPGEHTYKVQVFSTTNNRLYLRANTWPWSESFRMEVLQLR